MTSCSSIGRSQPLPLPSEALEETLQEASTSSEFTVVDKLPEDWWTLFDDPQLSKFILTALERNPTVQKAHAKIFSAAYAADLVRSTLYPNITWGADVSRQKLSKTGVIPFKTGPDAPPVMAPVTPGGTGGIPVYFTLYETQFNLKYEFDFWQKNRNTLRAALGEVQANVAEEAFARLQLSVAVAQTYFELQIDYKRQEAAQGLVNSRTAYRNLVNKRIQSNLDNELALQSAEGLLADAKRDLLIIQGDIAVKENQLRAYLADGFEEEIDFADISAKPLPRVPMPNDLPLHLISQRPDITAQLWLIHSAGRQIAVAKAGFYPDFSLNGFYGYQTIHFREWFKWPSSYFNIDPAVTLPIFDGGRLLANLHSSEINYNLAILEYNELILNAVKEVLDGVAVVRNSSQQFQEYQKLLDVQQKLYRLTTLRVQHNLNNSLDQYTSESDLQIARDREYVALGNLLQAILMLIKALGGGYDACDIG